MDGSGAGADGLGSARLRPRIDYAAAIALALASSFALFFGMAPASAISAESVMAQERRWAGGEGLAAGDAFTYMVCDMAVLGQDASCYAARLDAEQVGAEIRLGVTILEFFGDGWSAHPHGAAPAARLAGAFEADASAMLEGCLSCRTVLSEYEITLEPHSARVLGAVREPHLHSLSQTVLFLGWRLPLTAEGSLPPILEVGQVWEPRRAAEGAAPGAERRAVVTSADRSGYSFCGVAFDEPVYDITYVNGAEITARVVDGFPFPVEGAAGPAAGGWRGGVGEQVLRPHWYKLASYDGDAGDGRICEPVRSVNAHAEAYRAAGPSSLSDFEALPLGHYRYDGQNYRLDEALSLVASSDERAEQRRDVPAAPPPESGTAADGAETADDTMRPQGVEPIGIRVEPAAGGDVTVSGQVAGAPERATIIIEIASSGKELAYAVLARDGAYSMGVDGEQLGTGEYEATARYGDAAASAKFAVSLGLSSSLGVKSEFVSLGEAGEMEYAIRGGQVTGAWFYPADGSLVVAIGGEPVAAGGAVLLRLPDGIMEAAPEWGGGGYAVLVDGAEAAFDTLDGSLVLIPFGGGTEEIRVVSESADAAGRPARAGAPST